MCGGAGMNAKICSTIGFERQHNATLAIVDEEEFVAHAVSSLGPQPPNFEKIVELNCGPLVITGVEVPALYPHQVQLKREEGALLVDVRTDLQFDDVHIHGSICIPSFTSGFGSKLAWLADHDQEIVFIGRDDADGRSAAKLALAVGVRNITGLLAGGMTTWRQERHPGRSSPPGTTLLVSPTGSTPTARSRSCARAACAPGPPQACSSTTAHRM
jgi:hydroxyacylglutathione hydrolase